MRFTVTSICLAVGLFAAASTGLGQAVISSTSGSNSVFLGVNVLGELNVLGGPADNGGLPGATGIAYSGPSTGFAVKDATSPGCLCEGWGVSASGVSGYANQAVGTAGLTPISFVSDDPGGPSVAPPHGTFATSTVELSGFAPGGLTVEQAYSAKVAGACSKTRSRSQTTLAVP